MLYNLSESQIPIAMTTVPNDMALNKIRWDHDGRKAALGARNGTVFVYDIGKV